MENSKNIDFLSVDKISYSGLRTISSLSYFLSLYLEVISVFFGYFNLVIEFLLNLKVIYTLLASFLFSAIINTFFLPFNYYNKFISPSIFDGDPYEGKSNGLFISKTSFIVASA